jgi:hypothetical protein
VCACSEREREREREEIGSFQRAQARDKRITRKGYALA